jgi:hypothetical protein
MLPLTYAYQPPNATHRNRTAVAEQGLNLLGLNDASVPSMGATQGDLLKLDDLA